MPGILVFVYICIAMYWLCVFLESNIHENGYDLRPISILRYIKYMVTEKLTVVGIIIWIIQLPAIAGIVIADVAITAILFIYNKLSKLMYRKDEKDG